MAKSTRPRVIKTLGSGDYLCEIKSAIAKERRNLRVIYVYGKGFRRRHLLTSLLDSAKYPAAEIATVYHQRWTVERSFPRDKQQYRRKSRGLNKRRGRPKKTSTTTIDQKLQQDIKCYSLKLMTLCTAP